MLGHNKGSGLFSQGTGGLLGGNPMGPRQLNLVASEGFSGNGMATIGMDNTFSVIAHLPPPHNFSPYAPAVYAAYLVDSKGKNGFYAGTLKAAGNGMYQASFRSPVPLVHYNKVVVSLESPQGIGQAPQGPIVMKVKEGLFDGLGPVKKIGGDMWGKVKGFVGNRFGGNKETSANQSGSSQNPVQQPPMQQYAAQQPPYQQQTGYPQGTYPQQGGYQASYQGGGYQYHTYPKGRGMYPQGAYQPRPYTPQPTPQPYPNQNFQAQPQPAQVYSQPVQPQQTFTAPAVANITTPAPPAGQPQQTPASSDNNTE